MLPRKPRHLLYAVLFMAISVVCTSVLANQKVYGFLNKVVASIPVVSEKAIDLTSKSVSKKTESGTLSAQRKKTLATSAPMFMTIIQGADEEVGCSANGLTVARFNLCGNSDDRVLSLAGSHSSVSWQILNGGCSPDINEDCPNTTPGCYTQVSSGPTFSLDATSIPATVGSEFRVVVDGVNYYFKVKKSTITQEHVKTDFICGVPGRIQITNLSSAYEFSMDNGTGFGPWQGPTFENLQPGTYTIKARLQGVPNTCEYPYEPITIDELDMDIGVTFTDAQCSGDTGTITVTANNVPGPYKYTLLDSNGVPQEFTAFLPETENPYTFSAVGFGTYIVQVETQQCNGDPGNGINPPRESLDDLGNPIVIGAGLSPLDASTEVNNSFGCTVAPNAITSVDIIVNTSGGAAPYTFTVNGGPSQPSYTGTTTHTVTGPGTYDFVITDSNNCTITASASVEDLLPPDITVNGVDGDCTNGGARINFTVNDAMGYNLSYRVQSSDPWVITPSISVPAVPGGTLYDEIEVRYQQGGFECTMSLPNVTVTSVGAIVGSASKVDDRTCDGSGGVNGGQIDFTAASGGSGSGYTYSVDGVNFTGALSYPNLIAGTYTPIIRDGGGCRLELTPIEIFDVDPPTNLDFVQSNSNCALSTSDVQLVPTSNAPIVNYSIISPITLDNGGIDTFIGLDTTTSYIFQITDDNGCIYQEGFSPALISSIRAQVRAGGDLRVCTGATDGTGTFLVDGFANNYTYNINGGPESAPQSNGQVDLPPSGAGTYTITVTDVDTGCTDTASFDIEEPAAAINLGGSVTFMTCANNNLGRVTGNATGGWGGNRYTLIYPGGSPTTGPQTSPTFGNLSVAGAYTFIAEDSEGCTDSFGFTLTPINAPTIAIDGPATNRCYEPATGATIAVTSTAGTAPVTGHRYRINGGPLQVSPVFNGVGPGTYTVEVIDSNNCSDTVSIEIERQLRVRTNIVTEIPCGGAPGQIRVRADRGYLSGTGPKQYEVSADGGASFGTPTPLTTNTFFYDTNAPGDYVFRVTDNEGCITESVPITLNPPANIAAATWTAVPVSCGATDNGRVTIIPNATDGVPPYEVNFDGRGWSSQTVYSNLPAGTYPYLVRDARGCETPLDNVVIGTDTTPVPDAAVTDLPATCIAGTVSGGIEITNVTDGTPNFSFIVQDAFGAELARLDDVSTFPVQIIDPSIVPGTYTVITLDANGCRDVDTVTVDTNEVVITPINFTPAVTCDDTGFTYTVEVTPTIFPVTPTYRIRLQGQPTFYALNNNAGPDTHEFSNATDGIQYGVAYTVEVLAPNGCIYEEVIPPIDGFSDLEISAVSDGAFCDNFGNGNADFTIIDFLGPDLDIEIIDVNTGAVVDTDNPTGLTGGAGSSYSGSFDVPPGSYRIVVTDSDGCTDAANVDIFLNSPSIDVLGNTPANCNALGQLTFQGSGGTPFATGSPYLYAVVEQGNPVTYLGPTDTTDDFTDETTRTLPGSLVGTTYDIWVVDSRGCTFNVTEEVIQLQPDLVVPDPIVANQCNPASTSFDIIVWMPDTTDTPRFTLNGEEQVGVLNAGLNRYQWTYNVSSPGDYPITVVDANGCTGTGMASVAEFLFASVADIVQPSCVDNDGELTINATGGSGNFDYDLTGPVNISQSDGSSTTFTGLVPGTYSVRVTDQTVGDISGLCFVDITNIEIETAIDLAILSAPSTNISCNGETDGNIVVNIDPGNPGDPPLVFTLYESGTTNVVGTPNSTGFFDNLGQGTYDVVVVSAKNCEDRRNGIVIDEPALFSITASAPDFSCEPGTNRFSSSIITVDVVDPGTLGGGYQFGLTENVADVHSTYQTTSSVLPITLEVVDNGSPRDFIIYAIDGNGCRTEFNLPTINPPTDVVPAIVAVDPLDCANMETVTIELTTNPAGPVDFTVSTVSVVPVAPVTNAPGTNFVEVDLPAAGDYLFEVQDNNGGCAYPLPVHTVNEPLAPVVTISEAQPVICDGDSNGALFIEIDPATYVGEYTYRVFRGDDLTKTTSLASGTFDTAIDGNPATISNLPGGNFFVEVVSTATPYCTGDSGVATIRTPTGLLDVGTVEIGNVSCNDNTGIIEATGELGWTTVPYEYRLLQDTGSGFAEIVPFSTNHRFENLSSGSYQVEVRDAEGCTATSNIPLPIVPQLDAGIREPQALVCPGGNNAILEAYDPTTGDALTAIAGATGGFAGAGYNYRLLYLNSADNTDIHSTGGLQNMPTFATATGEGYLSAGWYAIEVSSSFGCLFVTDAYPVDPPPPIEPVLRQTQVPGCGGDGQMELSIENHDPTSGFEYEYRRIPTPDPVSDPWTQMGPGVSAVLLDRPGSPTGIFYQYEVRKINNTNVCDAVDSNGITLTDALGITVNVNTPDDISCASELDGRIESFVSGGVGNNRFFLYRGDPVDAFNPDPGATFLREVDDGTFEGLDEGLDYYVAVTSGITCYNVNGPHAIIRPDPIMTTSGSTPVSCNGEEDGTLTVEVTSGGVGLIQFAIAPNFNEFFSDPATPGMYTFDELGQGDYEVLVLDEDGCFVSVPVNIPEPDELEINNIQTTPELCIGANDGTMVFEIAGGTPFNDPLVSPAPYYEYKIEMIDPVNETGLGVFAPYDGSVIPNLQGGASYAIYVQDANGCNTSDVFTIGIGVDLTAQPDVVYGCEGVFPNSTSQVIMQDQSLLPRLLFALDVDDIGMADTTRSWGDLAPGDHTVYIYHENGCVNSVAFTIDAYDPLALSAEKTGPNELTATAAGGFGGYEFFFQGQSYGTDNVYTTNVSEIVEVRVVDQNGCVAVVSIPFEFTGMLEIPNFFTPNGDNENDLWMIKGREFFPDIEVIIYDRYGRVVATLDQVQKWDGTYEGNPLPSGDYWYVVNQNDARSTRFVGHFTLFR